MTVELGKDTVGTGLLGTVGRESVTQTVPPWPRRKALSTTRALNKQNFP